MKEYRVKLTEFEVKLLIRALKFEIEAYEEDMGTVVRKGGELYNIMQLAIENKQAVLNKLEKLEV